MTCTTHHVTTIVLGAAAIVAIVMAVYLVFRRSPPCEGCGDRGVVEIDGRERRCPICGPFAA